MNYHAAVFTEVISEIKKNLGQDPSPEEKEKYEQLVTDLNHRFRTVRKLVDDRLVQLEKVAPLARGVHDTLNPIKNTIEEAEAKLKEIRVDSVDPDELENEKQKLRVRRHLRYTFYGYPH